MKRIVILQPQLFPWIGVFEQVRLADRFLHFDDVQLPQGRSFATRVQIKTAQGVRWLSVPIRRRGGQRIDEVLVDDSQPWRDKHLLSLRHAYARAPFLEDMLVVVDSIYSQGRERLVDVTIAGIERISAYFGLRTRFDRTSRPPWSASCGAAPSARLLELARQAGADAYVTGHGARNYLDHALLERHGVTVEYMSYQRTSYPQQHGAFTPFVSVLDLIANCGTAGAQMIQSTTIGWREMLDGRQSAVC